MQVGMAHVNDQSVIDLPTCPFGGEKNSGIGRFNGNWAIEAFTTDQWATVQHTPRRYPWLPATSRAPGYDQTRPRAKTLRSTKHKQEHAMTVLTAVRTISLPSGEAIPVLGQGTWHMAEDPRRRREEIAALRLGIELGMSLIDTAEMYADGRAEELVGEAIEGLRDEVFLVSKVLPQHATLRGTIEACEDSLMRLGVDEIDLYLLHWRAPLPWMRLSRHSTR
jgi:hypothetical protein